jgi:hypothetical protein
LAHLRIADQALYRLRTRPVMAVPAFQPNSRSEAEVAHSGGLRP